MHTWLLVLRCYKTNTLFDKTLPQIAYFDVFKCDHALSVERRDISQRGFKRGNIHYKNIF